MIYLASRYSDLDPEVRGRRTKDACIAASRLMRLGLRIFSPIGHSHCIAEAGGLPTDWDFWEEYDRECLAWCKAMIVLETPGWTDSVGVTNEIHIMREMGRTVMYVSLHDILHATDDALRAKLAPMFVLAG